MKNFILLLTVSLATTLVSCSQEDKVNESNSNQKTELDGQFKMSLDNFTPFSTDTIVLFEAANVSELEDHINNTLGDFDDELDGIKAEYSNVDFVTYKLTFANNKAIVTDLYFLDTQSQVVVDVFEKYTASSIPDFGAIMGEYLFGKCPNGWTSEGSYSSKDGIAKATERILTPNLDSSGDCVQIQYARGVLSVQICYKKC